MSQVPPEQWLAGGLGTLPLAPLGDLPATELPGIIARMKKRIDREAPSRQATELWSATYILMGMRYPDVQIETLLQGVVAMEESVTYQKIIRKGEARGEANEARKMVVLMGRARFGEPSPEALAALDALTDVGRLEALGVRLLQAASWQELLENRGSFQL
ncbi:MAG: hypothetical protein K2R98_05705 [Gemmataceae bacterium]|nr:hypothetical protein [Gemmataceae bacterium]